MYSLLGPVLWALAAPAILLQMPPADVTMWTPVPALQYRKSLETASESRYEWAISVESDQITTRLKSNKRLFEEKPAFPLDGKEIPLLIRANARTISFRVEDGWLVAYDAGEWGAAIWWYSPDGKRNYQISDDPVKQFFRIGNGIVAITGLNHLAIDEGSVISIAREDGKWTAKPLAVLPQAGRVATRSPDGDLIVVTSSKLVRVTKEGKVLTLVEDTGFLPFPNSVAIGADGTVYIGMRQGLGVYEPKAKGLKLFIPTKECISAAEQEKQKLDWAREVLIDFLDSAVESKASAIGLLTPELAKAVENDKNADFLGLIRLRKYGQPVILKEELAPDGSEAVFSGSLTSNRDEKIRRATFKARITTNGKWCIRYMSIKEDQ